ncbi:MAG: HEPN domain-containing protein [Bacillota bacterium]
MSPPEVFDLLKKSERSLAAAERLLTDDFPDFAAGRAYYAMFYAVEALLLSRALSFSKHSAVIAAFGQHFVKPGVLPASLHQHLLDAYALRNLGDYGVGNVVEVAAASQVLENARVFCLAVRGQLDL